jgi:hypothetical protein
MKEEKKREKKEKKIMKKEITFSYYSAAEIAIFSYLYDAK